MSSRTRQIIISSLIFISLTYVVAWSPLFAVRSISIEGLPDQVPSTLIISKSKIEVGEKLSRIEPRSIERAISQLSWIKKVSVTRNWITGKVVVTVEERIPVGIYQGKVLDKSGTLFDFPGTPPSDLPVVTASTPRLGLEAISLFTHLPIAVRDSVISISAANENSISSWQRRGSEKVKVTWGDSKELDLKVSVLQALYELPENAHIKRVDLSAPHAPIVK